MIKEMAGLIFIGWGVLDAVKYELQASKIRNVKSAKEHSRMFLNMAIGNDVYRLAYFWFINKDYYVLATAILAIIFMLDYWYQIYRFYPYRNRTKPNFKRPDIFTYVVNSLLPNHLRRHL